MNDSQAAEEAFARHRENCVVCRTSGYAWERCLVGSQLMETWLKAKADEERARREAPRHWFESGLESLVSRGAMNRKGRACLWLGFLLLVVATLFPPWSYSYSYRSASGLPRLPTLAGSRPPTFSGFSYGFLLYPPSANATVNVSRLFVEYVFIALVTSGLLLSQVKRRALTTSENAPLAAAGPSSMKGGSYFKVNYPGLAREFIGHVDDRERVTLWEGGRSAPTGLTRDQLETYGVEFKTAAEDAITRHTDLENPKTYGIGKLWQRKFVIPVVIVLAIITIGFGYLWSRRIVRDLPPTEVSKLVIEKGYINGYGSMELDIYNGSKFVLTEVRVSISLLDEKGNAVFSNRLYRLPAFDFYPQQSKKLSTDVGFTLEQGQRWEWQTPVGAKGRPE